MLRVGLFVRAPRAAPLLRRCLSDAVPPPKPRAPAPSYLPAGLAKLLPPAVTQAAESAAGAAQAAAGALGKVQGSVAAAKASVEAAKSSVEAAQARVAGTVASAKSSVDGAKAGVVGTVASAKSSVDGAKATLQRQATMVKGSVDGAKSGLVGGVDSARARVDSSVALAKGGVDAAKSRLAEMAAVKQGLPPAVESFGRKLGVPPNVLRGLGLGVGVTRNVVVLAARVAEPLAMRAITRLLPKDKADVLRKVLYENLGSLTVHGRRYYQLYRLYIFAGVGVLAFMWVAQRLLGFIGTFVHTLESFAVYLIYIGTGLLMVLSLLLLRGRFKLSARTAHRRAAHLVAQSAEPVIAEKLGEGIKRTAGHQRIVTRSGGEFKLKWDSEPAATAAAAAVQSKAAAAGAAEAELTEVVVGTQEKMPEMIVQLMDTAAMKAATKCAHTTPLLCFCFLFCSVLPALANAVAAACSTTERALSLSLSLSLRMRGRYTFMARDKTMGLMRALGVPSVVYKPERAYLVFPMEGLVKGPYEGPLKTRPSREQRAMVSCEVKKIAGGVAGYYNIRLLAVDFPDDTYTILYGTQER
jgi:hypothetical protein